MIDGRLIKTSLGTTKYCSHFMKNQSCPKPDCMYLHELGDSEASFTKEEMHQGKHQEYEKRLHDALIAQTAATNNISPSGNTKLGETIKLSNENGCSDGEPGKDAWPCLSTSPILARTGKDACPTETTNAKDTNTSTTGSAGGGTATAATTPITITTTKSAKTENVRRGKHSCPLSAATETATKENGKKKKESKAKKTSTSSSASSTSSTTTTPATAATLTSTLNGKETVVNGGSGSAINNNNNIKDQGFNTNNKDLNNKDLDTTKPTMSADEELNLIQEIEKEADALSAAELDAKADTPSLRLVETFLIKLFSNWL